LQKGGGAGGAEAPVDQLKALKADLLKFIDEMNCGPILIRLAWHDSGTFDQRISSWPQRGGANAAITFGPELTFGANAGLPKAVKYLEQFKKKYPAVGWADLIQMASACAVKHMGGPEIQMTYGRKDVTSADQCAPGDSREGFKTHAGLPDAKPPFGCGASDPATHLRNVFSKKMGFNDEDIVALSGAHTIGRAFADRSGTCPFASGKPSAYTGESNVARHDGKSGVGMQGGQAWTKKWLKFDNEYFTAGGSDKDLLWLPTDQCLKEDAKFKPIFEQFARDQGAFFQAYARAHKKLSELGAEWVYRADV
jgi:L-ascorbate peroxidase